MSPARSRFCFGHHEEQGHHAKLQFAVYAAFAARVFDRHSTGLLLAVKLVHQRLHGTREGLLQHYRQLDTSCVFLNTRKLPPALITDDPLARLSSDDIVSLLDCSTRSAVTLFQYLMMHLCVIDYVVTARLAPLAKERFKAFEDHYGDALREYRDRSIARVRAGHARLQRAVGLL